MTTEEITTIFQITSAGIERHIKRPFATGELDEREVKTEEMRLRNGRQSVVEYYNLDMIIALCFRIDTPCSKAFRRWITEQVVRSLKREPMQPLILRIESRNETAN